MSKLQDMLDLRRRLKKKKPHFLRQDFQIKKLKTKWIKAKGIHSKMRRKMAGHIAMPHPGFGSPRIARGLNAQGLKEIIVLNSNDLDKVGTGCCAIIGGNVGLRKRVEIARKASEMKIKLGNISDDFIKNVEEMIKKRNEEKKVKKEKKISSKKETEDKSKAKENEDRIEKEKKEEEKEIKKKVLEKRT